MRQPLNRALGGWGVHAVDPKIWDKGVIGTIVILWYKVLRSEIYIWLAHLPIVRLLGQVVANKNKAIFNNCNEFQTQYANAESFHSSSLYLFLCL